MRLRPARSREGRKGPCSRRWRSPVYTPGGESFRRPATNISALKHRRGRAATNLNARNNLIAVCDRRVHDREHKLAESANLCSRNEQVLWRFLLGLGEPGKKCTRTGKPLKGKQTKLSPFTLP